MNIEQAKQVLKTAAADHQAGRLDEAKAGYEAVLALDPNQVDSLQLLGVLRHQQGEQEEGMALVERAIALDPKNPNIRNNFAGMLRDLGRLPEAEEQFAASIALAPNVPETYVNHGIVLEQIQRYDDAYAVYAACLARVPGHVRALRGLTTTLLTLARHDEAEPHLRRLNELQPHNPETLGNLAIVLHMRGATGEAETLFREAIDNAAEKPAIRSSLLSLLNNEPRDEAAREVFRQLLRDDPEAWKMEMNVAHHLLEIGRFEQTVQIIDDILSVHDQDSQVWNDAGATLLRHNKYREASVYLKRAIELDPRSAMAYCNIGAAHLFLNQLAEAVNAYREALMRNPAAFQAQVNIVRALRLMLRFEEAHIFARAALDLMQTQPNLAVNKGEATVLLLQFFKTICDFNSLDQLGNVWDISEAVPPRALPAIFLDHLVFAETKDDVQRFVGLVRKWATYVEARAAQTPLEPRVAAAPKKRFRVGILSSDLRAHSVSRFVMPLFEGYDREKMELFCYAPLIVENDHIQQKLSGLSTSYKFVDGLTDREIAAIIQADDIDILIELNGFTQFSRLEVLAYKPAPVQMSWLGYPFTCGLKAIDYVVLDRFVAPVDEATLTEQPLIMPGAWVCFGKFPDTPINPVLPMERNGYVTFGTLNNPYKFNRTMIETWAKVLLRVPNSRLLIVRPESSSVTLVRHIATEFAKHGVSSDRLYFRNNRAERRDHYDYYNEIDISLDSFPLTGGTTTCEATWMGVPVVSLVGEAFHQRISYSALMQCGLDELCTFTHEEFVERAVALVDEREKLSAWRTGLREILRASPLCDEPRFLHQFQEMLEQVADLHGLR
ncbi:MAG TPA: tetratricopeptide repeat protein [Alphaproteobacteria bacterium]